MDDVEAWAGHEATFAKADISHVFEDLPQEVKDVLQLVQAHIFTRRIRAKDCFLDFDPLRSGRCTPQQFARGVRTMVPSLSQAEVKLMEDHFTDHMEQIIQPQVVSYWRFARAVDAVFVVPDLEKYPTIKVPRPGASLETEQKVPRSCDDEAAMELLLRKIALLTKTRGVIFRERFQDCERSLDTSLLCPRFSGKVTDMQFLQNFPFMQDVNDYELKLLIQRYSTEQGDVNYVAMDKDLEVIQLEPPSPQSSTARSPLSSRGGGFFSARSKLGPAATSVMGSKDTSGLRLATTQDYDIEVLVRLKAEVAAKRLRVHGCFQEMDRLRRGVVTMGQARTVFTILRMELEFKELEAVQRLFDNDGMFDYTHFCNVVNEVPLSARNGELPPTVQPSTPPAGLQSERVRVQNPLNADGEDQLAAVEIWIFKRCELRTMNAKSFFQDFDRVRSGRVTRNQFLRIMDMMQLGLVPWQLEVLMEAYHCINGREFSYLDMCNSIQRRAVQELGRPMSTQLGRRTPDPARYFTRKGQIVPNMKASMLPLSARPFTR